MEDYLRSHEDDDEIDILLMQEVPHTQPEWTKIREIGKFVVLGFQDEESWRGTAVAINAQKLQLLKKRACAHGIWVQLFDALTAQKLWVGSAYLSTGISLMDYQIEYRLLLEQLPANSDAVIMGGDINVGLNWQPGEQGSTSTGSSGKLRGLKSACATRRMVLVPQRQPFERTHVSRRDPGVGGQIDCFWCSRVQRCSQVEVEKESRKIIGTDHELIALTYLLEKKRVKLGGPRMVIGEVNPPEVITQQSLQELAKTSTAPVRKPQVPLPESIVVEVHSQA